MAEPRRPAPSTTSQSRFARRRWLARIGRYKWHLTLVLGVGLLAGACWLVFVSSALGVRDVRVEGVRLLSAQEVRDAADVGTGTALASLDTDEIADRVGGLTPVASATVSRDWPHQVRIVVQERSSVAAVRRDGRLFGMDSEGVLYRRYRDVPATLPLVDADGLDDEGQDEAMVQAARAVAALDPRILRRVASVEVASRDDITLLLDDDDRVTWGSGEDSEVKADVLAALLGEPASVYDVSVPAQPTTVQ